MQTRHLLITLLLLAHVLVGLVVWSMGELPREFGNCLLLVVIAGSQVGLLAIWLALGRRAAPWRLVALIGTIVGWSWIVASVQGGYPDGVIFLLPQAAAIAAILVLARMNGLRLYQIDSDLNVNASDDSEDNRPWQFSLSQLFAWTTSLAICLGLLSLTFQHFHGWEAVNWVEVLANTIGSIAFILISLWLTLGIRLSYLELVVLSLIVVTLALLTKAPSSVTPSPHSFWDICLNFVKFFALPTPFFVGSFLVFRVAGYRLSWKRKNS